MKKLWNWLNGKKTIISAIYFAILSYIQTKGYIGAEELHLLNSIGMAMLGVGIGHKIGKAEAKQKVIKNDT